MDTRTTSPLDLEQVTVTYPDGERELIALDSVSLQVRAGQMVALTGESGSGKSTLLSVAAGLLAPTAGAVTVAGHRIDGLDLDARARVRRDHIGIVFQQSNLLAPLTMLDQLLVVDHLRGVRPRPERARELLGFVGLGDLAHRRIGELSGGQRQRVNIARALMAGPEVLLADEPTSALDSTLSREVIALLRRVTEELDTATLVVTHDRGLLEAFDGEWEMADGHLANRLIDAEALT